MSTQYHKFSKLILGTHFFMPKYSGYVIGWLSELIGYSGFRE